MFSRILGNTVGYISTSHFVLLLVQGSDPHPQSLYVTRHYFHSQMEDKSTGQPPTPKDNKGQSTSTGCFLDDTTKSKLNQVVSLTELHFKLILTKCTTSFFQVRYNTFNFKSNLEILLKLFRNTFRSHCTNEIGGEDGARVSEVLEGTSLHPGNNRGDRRQDKIQKN